MKTSLLRLLSLVAAVVLTVGTVSVRAENLGSVKARLAERLPQLDQLKKSGAIGENNQGLAEVRADAAQAASVVASENQDRRAVYAAIAEKTGSTVEAVGRARARQIAAASASGLWLQREDGTWYKK